MLTLVPVGVDPPSLTGKFMDLATQLVDDSDSEAAQLAAGYLEACEENLNKSKKRKERKKKQKVKLSDDVNVAAEEAVQGLMDPKQ